MNIYIYIYIYSKLNFHGDIVGVLTNWLFKKLQLNISNDYLPIFIKINSDIFQNRYTISEVVNLSNPIIKSIISKINIFYSKILSKLIEKCLVANEFEVCEKIKKLTYCGIVFDIIIKDGYGFFTNIF